MTFQLTSFTPHPWIRGGHLQTIWPKSSQTHRRLSPQRTEVEVSEGDRIVLHCDDVDRDDVDRDDVDGCNHESADACAAWEALPRDTINVLLIHGLTGCHAAPYMLSLTDELLASGARVYRMDMRGFGSAWGLSKNLSHAGRSDDVIAALQTIANQTHESTPIFAVGVSLGGAQLLRGIGRIDAGLGEPPPWWPRFRAAVAVSPPIDLIRCSQNMERPGLWGYNRYFIGSLLRRAPKLVKERPDFRAALAEGRPKTLWELDDRITAPLSGFANAEEYYTQASSKPLLHEIQIPTLLITSLDDPIVPADCFAGTCPRYAPTEPATWDHGCRLFEQSSGGHVGFVSRHRNRWLESTISDFIADQTL